MNDEILDLISSRSITWLVGAGISVDKPAGLASVHRIISAIIHFSALKFENDLLSLKELRYERVIQEWRDQIDPKLKLMDYFVQENVLPNSLHQFLANRIISGDLVLTTNFDCLIEHALSNIEINSEYSRIAVITPEDFIQYQDPDSKLNQYRVYKIHGSPINYFTGKKTRNSIKTTLDALSKDKAPGEEIFSLPLYQRHLFEKIDEGRILIVMGYGGGDDFDIMPELSRMDGLVGLIWIDHHSDRDGKKPLILNPREILQLEEDEIPKQGSRDIFELLRNIGERIDIPVRLVQGQTLEILRMMFPNTIDNQLDKSKGDNTIPIELWLDTHFEPPNEISALRFVENLFINYNRFSLAAPIQNRIISLTKRSDPGGFPLAMALINQGKLLIQTGEMAAAKYPLFQASDIGEKLKNPIIQVSTLMTLGIIDQKYGMDDIALKKFKTALNMEKSRGEEKDLALMAKLTGLTGDTCKKTNPKQALEYYQEALDLEVKIGNQEMIAIRYNDIGSLNRVIGNIDAAINNHKKAITIDQKLKNRIGEARGMIELAECLLIRGNDKDNISAEHLLEEARKIRHQLGVEGWHKKGDWMPTVAEYFIPNFPSKAGTIGPRHPAWKSRVKLEIAAMMQYLNYLKTMGSSTGGAPWFLLVPEKDPKYNYMIWRGHLLVISDPRIRFEIVVLLSSEYPKTIPRAFVEDKIMQYCGKIYTKNEWKEKDKKYVMISHDHMGIVGNIWNPTSGIVHFFIRQVWYWFACQIPFICRTWEEKHGPPEKQPFYKNSELSTTAQLIFYFKTQVGATDQKTITQIIESNEKFREILPSVVNSLKLEAHYISIATITGRVLLDRDFEQTASTIGVTYGHTFEVYYGAIL
ncbi:MAG: SIR2 family protein [Candidatus Lokiarchaeota archaeon]|nr:SIR2 family protein [Candidatus Lokiarchaeota archaeon]